MSGGIPFAPNPDLATSPTGVKAADTNPQLLQALGIPNFDAAWYMAAYPDVGAAKMDPVQHYLTYGAKEGRKQNAGDDGSAGRQMSAPTPQPQSAPLDPRNPQSMSGWAQQAHNETAGLNYLPRVAPNSATLSANPAQTVGQFYPGIQQQQINGIMQQFGLGQPSQAQPALNLGMGSPGLNPYTLYTSTGSQ